jgi:hypothetical protein
METIQDFEDMLDLLGKHGVRYLIIGGLAFIFHAKPRYTKDMDIWIEPSADNVRKANVALAEFGSPILIAYDEPSQVLQIGIAPDRIDFLVNVGVLDFETAWSKRIVRRYGGIEANWIDLDGLLEIKRHINSPKHQEDARVLQEIKKLRENE